MANLLHCGREIVRFGTRGHWEFVIARATDGEWLYSIYVLITDRDGSDRRRRIGQAETLAGADAAITKFVELRNRPSETPTYRVSLEGGRMKGIRRES